MATAAEWRVSSGTDHDFSSQREVAIGDLGRGSSSKLPGIARSPKTALTLILIWRGAVEGIKPDRVAVPEQKADVQQARGQRQEEWKQVEIQGKVKFRAGESQQWTPAAIQ